MDAISYTMARANLASMMNQVCEDHEPLIITRNGQQSVVMLSLEDYKALEETAYLLRSPENAKRLLKRINQLIADTRGDPVAGIGECWCACGSKQVWPLLPTPPVGRLPPEMGYSDDHQEVVRLAVDD